MTRLREIAGRILTPAGLAPGVIRFDDRIRELELTGEPEAATGRQQAAGAPAPPGAPGPTWGEGNAGTAPAHSDAAGPTGRGGRAGAAREAGPQGPQDDPAVRSGEPLVLPGFIDVHVHGGGGADTMDGAEGVRTLARFHLRHGTTTLLPTTITNPWERVLAALHGVRAAMADADPELPTIPGAHLEGPFINPERLGAQPPNTLLPEPELVEEALATGAVRVVTLAPELGGAPAAALRFARAGARVSLGHTRADYDTALRAAREVAEAGGVAGFTHLYNAMGGLEGRRPGAVAAALACAEAYAELIFDTHHVHEGALRAALAAKPDRLMFVTDAIRAAGEPEGATELGGQPVTVAGGAARLADGTLAGSVLTMDQALRNGLAAGLTWPQLASLLAAAPARYLGLADRGELAPGKRADLVVLDGDLRVGEVFLAGRPTT